MKALLVVLGLALGAVVLYVLMDAGAGRGSSERATPSRPSARIEPAAEEGRASEEHAPDEASRSAPMRASVESTPLPANRAVLEGAVIGDGAPLPGVSLSILRDGEVLAESKTDPQGRFRLDCPHPTNGTLRVSMRGFVTLERRLVTRSAGGTEKLGNIRLLHGRRLVGKVIDGLGKGIPDVDLRASPFTAGTDVLISRARSGPDGTFEFADAPAGIVVVNARARGYGERDVKTSAAGPLEIAMEPGSDLRLRLQTPSGKPVVGAEVTIAPQGDPRNPKRTASSDVQGRVVFEGLSEKVWIVRASHDDYRAANTSTAQANGIEQVLECWPWPAIEGRVRLRDGGPPPAGTVVQAIPASAPSDRVGSFTGGKEVDAEGNFRLGGLRAGDWRVRAIAPGLAPGMSEPVRLGIDGDGFAGVIQLDKGETLVFTVTVDERPLPDAEVELLRDPPTPAQLWALANSRGVGLGKRVKTDARGQATFENLLSGNTWVAVFAEGCPPTSFGPYETTGSSSARIPVQLARGGRIQGLVKDPDGKPMPGVQLRIVENAGSLGFPITLATAADGRYTSSWLPAGRYQVEAFAPADPKRRSGESVVDLKAGELRTLDLTL